MDLLAGRPLTFDPCFGKLGREIARFANHTQKLLRASQKYRRPLEAAAAASEGAAPLDRAPVHPARAMAAVDEFAARGGEDRAALLGAYFAHHQLRAQAELARTLLRAAASVGGGQGAGPTGKGALTCHRAYQRAYDDRKIWVAALLDLLIASAAPDLSRDDYAALNVGSLTDHEDVDLAIVVASPVAQAALGRAFTTVSKTFVRYASKIQLFLTEQLATPRTGARVEEYEQVLAGPQPNVVAATQLLSAEYLCGSPHLARALDERVTSRYYAEQGTPAIHEGYLRAVMAELGHHLLPDNVPGVLSPKREVYVPAKLVVAAVRLLHGLHEPRPPAALARLANIDPDQADTYRALAAAFVQNEILRSLLFQYVMPSDDIDLSDVTVRAAARRVAVLLGLGTSSRLGADRRLLGAYAEIRAQALRAVAALSLKIARHLGRVSTFRKLVESGVLDRSGHNLALDLVEILERHQGGVFWDEVVELIANQREMAARFFAGLADLGISQRRNVVRRYVSMMVADAGSLVELLVLMEVQDREARREAGTGSAGGAGDVPLASLFWWALMRLLRQDPASLDVFVTRLDTETRAEALFRLATAYRASQLAALANEVERASTAPKHARVARAIRSVIFLVHHTSNSLSRLAYRVLGRTPEFLQRLGDARRLKDLASEVSTRAARAGSVEQQIELFGDAFDVAALRAALIAILDAAPQALDPEFTGAVDGYVRELFGACARAGLRVEVGAGAEAGADAWAEIGSPDGAAPWRPGSRIALFATGGYGRGEAFGADWDYIAVVAGEDAAEKLRLGKVLQQVSQAMARRGLMPHNRFTDHFNAYVVSIPELVGYFSRRGPETFIDEAEVLEARFLLGDPEVARTFEREVWARVAETNRAAFMRDLLAEITDRRRRLPPGLNIKLGAGGLREIHLLWLAIRLHAELPGPLVPALLPLAAEALPGHRRELSALMAANDELRRARELYRLTVASDDDMEAQLLTRVAKDLEPLRRAGVRAPYELKLRRLMAATARRIDRVAATLAEA